MNINYDTANCKIAELIQQKIIVKSHITNALMQRSSLQLLNKQAIWAYIRGFDVFKV